MLWGLFWRKMVHKYKFLDLSGKNWFEDKIFSPNFFFILVSHPQNSSLWRKIHSCLMDKAVTKIESPEREMEARGHTKAKNTDIVSRTISYLKKSKNCMTFLIHFDRHWLNKILISLSFNQTKDYQYVINVM